MSSNIKRIQWELDGLGYKTTLRESPRGQVVSFEYSVEVGTHKGSTFVVGLSFQGDEEYPEYPPHWIHVTPPIDDGKGGAVEKYTAAGREWMAMSRPPGALWDDLPTKHMYNYMMDHLRRLWSEM